jgi:hypothetical protein
MGHTKKYLKNKIQWEGWDWVADASFAIGYRKCIGPANNAY